VSPAAAAESPPPAPVPAEPDGAESLPADAAEPLPAAASIPEDAAAEGPFPPEASPPEETSAAADSPPDCDAAPVEVRPVEPPPRPPWWRVHLVGLLLGGVYLATLIPTARDIGFARDEGFYFTAADEYQKWFDVLLKNRREAMKREVVERYWGVNAEHPPLMKVAFGFSHRLFHQKLDWMRPSTSYRFPGMLCAALLLYLVYVFAARRFGELEGFLAAGFLALMPRFFYHAHLDAFDVPIAFFVFATAFAFEKSLRSHGWALVTGALFGLALLTKLNAFFLLPTFGVIWIFRDLLRPTTALVLGLFLLVVGTATKLSGGFVLLTGAVLLIAVLAASDRRRGFLGLPPIPSAFFLMLVLGPLMLWALWPWMWHDTFKHFGGYLKFHLDHPHYNMAYFGTNYFRPPLPFSYPFVMSVFTMPLVTVFCSLVGLLLVLRLRVLAAHRDLTERARAARPAAGGWWARLCARAGGWVLRPWRSVTPGPVPDDRLAAAFREHPGLDVFLAVNLLVPIYLIAHPRVFIFGGTKHWMPAWPFLAIFAALGAGWALRRIAAWVPARFASPRLGPIRFPVRGALLGLGVVLVLAPAARETGRSHPFGLSHYTLPAGGTAGAADWGMCRQFWGFTTGSLLPWLNANVPHNGAVFFHDTAWDSYRMFQTDGTLRKDIRWAHSPEAAVVSLVHHELHMAETEYAIWTAYGTAAPVHVLDHDGVSIISVYARPGTPLGYQPPPSAPRRPASAP
jgi:hypothetical protein